MTGLQPAELPASDERARDRIQERENAAKYRAMLLDFLRARFDIGDPEAWTETTQLPPGAWGMIAKQSPRTFEWDFHPFIDGRSNVWRLRLHRDLRRQMRGIL